MKFRWKQFWKSEQSYVLFQNIIIILLYVSVCLRIYKNVTNSTIIYRFFISHLACRNAANQICFLLLLLLWMLLKLYFFAAVVVHQPINHQSVNRSQSRHPRLITVTHSHSQTVSGSLGPSRAITRFTVGHGLSRSVAIIQPAAGQPANRPVIRPARLDGWLNGRMDRLFVCLFIRSFVCSFARSMSACLLMRKEYYSTF